MNAPSDKPLTRWQLDRRAFIEHRVFWHGRIGLADLMDTMGLSRAQASKDLNGYIADHVAHLVYDKSVKTYITGLSFEAHYADLDPGEYLGDLLAVTKGAAIPRADWFAYIPEIVAAAAPARGLDAKVVQAALQASEQRRELSVTYQPALFAGTVPWRSGSGLMSFLRSLGHEFAASDGRASRLG